MFHYRGLPVLTSEACVRESGGAAIEIGDPRVVASRDESPDEGLCVGPALQAFGETILLNWRFDWDVVDPELPNAPNGRLSRDGGRTWEKQITLIPPGVKWQTGTSEITCWHKDGFEEPDHPGVYRIPVHRSHDTGNHWSGQSWVTVHYPGTKGLDIYAPPAEYRRHDHNFKGGHVKRAPPAHLEPFFREVSRLRGPGLHPQAIDPDGALYSLVAARYLKNVEGIKNWDREFWSRVKWNTRAILLQRSQDNGRTWEFGGVPVDGADHEGAIDADRTGFTEPSMVFYPDGEAVCVFRTGHFKPLHLIRSRDRGMTWTQPQRLSACGVKPHLARLGNGFLALGTGRPDCTLHFSRDRGRTWFHSETLYTVNSTPFIGTKRVLNPREDMYCDSFNNISMIAMDDNTLLYVHDATRWDPAGENLWLRRHGHGLIIARTIRIRVR